MIYGFTGAYRWLSNFWPCVIRMSGVDYPTAEHAYQAAKTLNKEDRLAISQLSTPGQAKKAGRALDIRPNWDDIKLKAMKAIVMYKFKYNDELRNLLLATGEEEIMETNYWGDTFWGVCNGIGQNHLGKILMEVRKELMA